MVQIWKLLQSVVPENIPTLRMEGHFELSDGGRLKSLKFSKKSRKHNWKFQRVVVGGLNQKAFCGSGMNILGKEKTINFHKIIV